MNYIDKHLKQPSQNKIIGIIITKKDNNYVIEYSSDDKYIRQNIYKINMCKEAYLNINNN